MHAGQHVDRQADVDENEQREQNAPAGDEEHETDPERSERRAVQRSREGI